MRGGFDLKFGVYFNEILSKIAFEKVKKPDETNYILSFLR